jgi:RimJ/RimL family protein N-acetyltransferase
MGKKQPGVKSIIASVEKINIASLKVLQKNYFIQIGETETLSHWKLRLKEVKEI